MTQRLDESLAALARVGVRVPVSGRHRLAHKTLMEWNRRGTLKDAEDAELRRIEAAHRTMWETFLISVAADRMRHNPTTPFTVPKLQEMMGGGVLDDDKDVEPRNTQFELYIGALLHLAGLSVYRGEPDIRFDDGQSTVGVAAKRIRSGREDQIAKHVKKARDQIVAANLQGWIALNFDKRFVDVDPLDEEDELLAEFDRVFNQANAALVEVHEDRNVLGFMIFGYCSNWRETGDSRSLHAAYPSRWVRWTNSSLDAERFAFFADLWHARIASRLEALASPGFEGQL